MNPGGGHRRCSWNERDVVRVARTVIGPDGPIHPARRARACSPEVTFVHPVSQLLVEAHVRLATRTHLAFQRHRLGVGPGSERGQATAEYALVLLGVAAVALMLAAWAAKTGKIGRLFDAVVDQLIAKVR